MAQAIQLEPGTQEHEDAKKAHFLTIKARSWETLKRQLIGLGRIRGIEATDADQAFEEKAVAFINTVEDEGLHQ